MDDFDSGLCTLSLARMYLYDNLDEGVRCPCCHKFARRYRRRFNGTMARSLMWLVRAYAETGDWVNVAKTAPRWVVRSNQLPTIRWWKLAIRPADCEDPKLKHSGSWKPTEKGIAFVNREIKIPSTCVTWNGEVEDLEGDYVDIKEILGVKFDYSEVMGYTTHQWNIL